MEEPECNRSASHNWIEDQIGFKICLDCGETIARKPKNGGAGILV